MAHFVSTAMANHDNLTALQERAAELMDVIIEKHVRKEDQAASQGGSRASKAGSRMYCQLMEKFRDLLDGILAYTNEYRNRNFIMKMLLTGQDADQFQEMVDELAKLLASAHFSVSVDTHSMVTDVQSMSAEMKGMLEEIRSQTQYKDHSSEVQRLVDDLGGIDAVTNNDAKLDEVVKHLDSGQQIMTAIVKNQVTVRLSKDADLRRFQEFVEKKDGETISVKEVNCAFPYGISLSKAVERSLGLQEDGVPGAPTAAISDSAGTLTSGHVSSRHLQQENSPPGKTGTYKLPKLEQFYVGREQDALALVHAFQQQLDSRSGSRKAAVCIVAGAGMGKSSLSLDVGWRMAKAEMCPAGAVFVDMREALTFEAAIGRMCYALGVPMDEHAVLNIKSDLKSQSSAYGGPLLMLLDNTEDPVCKNEGPQLADFLIEVSELAVLLITSRVPVAADKGMQQYELRSMDVSMSHELMRSIATNLEDTEVREAVELCRGVPLLVHRAADALQTGQIVLQDLQDAIATSSDHTSAVLNLTLCTLPRQQQLQLASLSVFPSNFSVDGAAAVLGWSADRASILLGIFYRHGLVMRGSGTNPFSLHMAVREASAALGKQAVAAQGAPRFVTYVFQQLDLWTRMFFTRAWEAPLALAREAGPDILAAFKLAGALVAQQPQPQASMLHSILAVDAELVQELLLCAGYRKGTWKKLERLHESIDAGSAEQKAAALLLKCMACTDFESAAKAHDLCCHALGPDNPRSIACVHAMATEQSKKHRYRDAEALFREAYERRLRVMGEQAPATWMSLQGLARRINDQGLPAKAEPLWSEVLEVLQGALGELHPSTLVAKMRLALCLKGVGKLAEAEVLCQEVLTSRQHVLGANHPDSVSSVNSLAVCIQKQGKLTEAEVLFRESLTSRQRLLGPNHPETITSVNNLAYCLGDQGKLAEAEVLYRGCYASQQRVLGPDHPHTMESVHNLANCLENQGKLAEAESLYRVELEACHRANGFDDSDTLDSLENLASIMKKQGKIDGALNLYRELLTRQERAYGPNHAETTATKIIVEELALSKSKAF
ncbi:hypothetical protein DUNSADRAFT_4377 [Dunaliella salina]|uniref:Kinesin light chain n=1 Tax=Dunaliella salina TaxID=3046 RepID=A0ABQ7GS68_DUNSA|nr:hypothetical protein DUNSADRAFT_4377 [Dunaliella salina]|eukprot:KAF5837461.1 hypothetical protein DUNSADRAFT_4377 [Dunaliella salina]